MKNKGFTLIELLAVIVILAIIALIATPIILNIIDSSKTESLNRSKDNYLHAVEIAVANYQLNHPEGIDLSDTTCTVLEGGNLECNGKTITVAIDGTKPTEGTITFENGKIKDYEVTIDGNTIEGSGDGSGEMLYTGTIYRNSTDILYVGDNIDTNRWCAVSEFGSTCENNDDEFYMVFNSEEECELIQTSPNELEEWEQEWLENATCEPGTLSYETNLANINTNAYLKHEVVNNEVTASYACITYVENGTRKDVCVRGIDSSYYASNRTTIKELNPYFNILNYKNGNGYCSDGDTSSRCYSDSLKLFASPSQVTSEDDALYCYVVLHPYGSLCYHT